MNPPDNSVLRIGALRVDPALDEICKDGTTIKLEPRTMRLLVCLAGHAGQVVSVEQLLDEVWNDVVVNPDSVYQAVTVLRRVLGDDAKAPTYIANVLRRGYRLIAPVTPWVDALAVPGADSPAITSTVTTAPPAAGAIRSPFRWSGIALIGTLALVLAYLAVDKLWRTKHVTAEVHEAALPAPATTPYAKAVSDKSIAVLPFIDLSEMKDQEYFADGMAEEILDLLANIPGLTVIGRTSSFQFKGKSEDLRAIGTKLGAAYVVEGSVRRSGDRVRITAQLIDTKTGTRRWSVQPFDVSTGTTVLTRSTYSV
jgi:transcriptional activator of cad operon